MEQPVQRTYDDWSQNYDRWHDEDPFIAKVDETLAWDNMRRFLPPVGGLILDAGGGTGRWAVKLAKMGYAVVLADISQGMLEVAKEKIRATEVADKVKLLHLDICDLDGLPDEHFDMVLAEGEPLSYCRDARRAVEEFARVTKKGAHVVASSGCRYSMTIWYIQQGQFEKAEEFLRSGDMLWESGAQHPFRAHAFTSSELRQLFESAGLRVVRLAGRPAFLSRMARQHWLATPDDWATLLEDKESLQRVLKLEMEYADESGWCGASHHLQIVGVK
jgi:ubiquinone/menaquinone biosynthesis C-methylase UbiE